MSNINIDKIEKAVEAILDAVGEDKNREGLKETPRRVAEAYKEILDGHNEEVKLKEFQIENFDELVIIRDINFFSLCEHHMLPFYGKVSIAYLPKDNKVVGVSKFARVVDMFSKRLQIQERMTSQIADYICDNIEVKGVVVISTGQHTCMIMRGVKKEGTEMVCSALRGIFREKPELRMEALKLMGVER